MDEGVEKTKRNVDVKLVKRIVNLVFFWMDQYAVWYEQPTSGQHTLWHFFVIKDFFWSHSPSLIIFILLNSLFNFLLNYCGFLVLNALLNYFWFIWNFLLAKNIKPKTWKNKKDVLRLFCIFVLPTTWLHRIDLLYIFMKSVSIYYKIIFSTKSID